MTPFPSTIRGLAGLALRAAVLATWAAGTVGAIAQSWSWPVVLLFSIGLLALLLVAADELLSMFVGPSTRSNAALKSAVRDWLRRQRYEVEESPQPDAVFRLIARAPEREAGISLLKRRDDPATLRIGAEIVVPRSFTNQLARVSPVTRAEALEDLRVEVARLGMSSRGIGSTLTAIQIEESLLCDESLTAATFFQGLRRIDAAAALLRQQLNRLFRRIENATPATAPSTPADGLAIAPERPAVRPGA